MLRIALGGATLLAEGVGLGQAASPVGIHPW
jgi:hypothetical protein